MIKHPDRTGKVLAALSLLTDHTHRITLNGGNTIKVSLGASEVKEFHSEEEFLVWVLYQIKQAAGKELDWFRQKYPTAYVQGLQTYPQEEHAK